MRTIMKGLLALTLALPLAAQEPANPPPADPPKTEEGEKPKEDAGDPEALKAIREGAELSMKKKFTFKASMDVEVAGAPMMAMEMKGEHAGGWTHMATEVMGNAIEVYSDGKRTVGKDPRTGEWRRQDQGGGGRRGLRGGLGMDQIVKVVTSAKFDGEAKVGSHECRVIRGKADAEAIRGLMGGGRMGGGEVKKSSLKFYVDKKDGRLRRMKLTMDAESNMGGQGPMELHIVSDYRYTYRKELSVEIPEEVKALLEEAPEEGGEEKPPADPQQEEPKSDK
ncbi:MAG: hypothetical protein IT452_13245 [Planctomycetia bacterium]|nr:hypothetical protein [Planctomycetia bacterium]